MRMSDEKRDLIEAQIPALRRFAYALSRDAALADDLVQECLLRALSRWHLLRSGPELRGWLYKVLRNLFLDAMRRKARRGEQGLEAVPEAGAPGDAEERLEVSAVLAALWRLPEEQRAPLLLIGVEDFSYEEAAAILGIPMGTLTSRLARGRAALREMTGRGEDPGPKLRRVK